MAALTEEQVELVEAKIAAVNAAVNDIIHAREDCLAVMREDAAADMVDAFTRITNAQGRAVAAAQAIVDALP